MKVVNYRGMTFEIGDHFQYIATDDDGDIYVYEREPFYRDGNWTVRGGDYKMLSQVIEGGATLEKC